jgi:hypothetical protein
MRRLASSGSVIALGFLAAGCPNPGGDVPLESLGQRLSPSYCALFDRCGNPFLSEFLLSGTDCATGIVPFLEDSFVSRAEASVLAGTVVYRGDLVDACLTAIDGAGCDITRVTNEACTDVFEGTVAAGGDCAWDEECVEGYCAITGACPGTCANRVAAGAACTSDQACPTGYSCSAGTCQERSLAGEPCGGAAALQCAGIDLQCVGSMGATPGTCRAWSTILDGAAGESCNPQTFDLCDSGISCVFESAGAGGATYVCAAGVAAGAACAIGAPDQCPAGQFCMMGTGTPGMGLCTALPGEGDACPDNQCGIGLRCADHGGTDVCVTPARLGAACMVDADCVSSSCEDGVCASPGC